MEKYPVYWPQFYTVTILVCKPLLSQDKYKNYSIESLQFLVKNNHITTYAFVIMKNHVHLIWQVLPDRTPEMIQASFMKFTARKIKLDLIKNHPLVLEKFKVNAKDKEYQFLKKNPLGIDLYTHNVFMQKLEYIHWHPVKAGLSCMPVEYYYSSAKFYHTGKVDFEMLTHC